MRWLAVVVVMACHAQPRPSHAPDAGQVSTITGIELKTDDTPANLGDAGVEGTPGEEYGGFGSGAVAPSPASNLLVDQLRADGSLPPDAIRDALSRDLALVEPPCATPLRKAVHGHAPTFELSFQIWPDGAPGDVRIDGDDAASRDCLLDAAGRFLFFPKPPDGKPVRVSVKLVYYPRH